MLSKLKREWQEVGEETIKKRKEKKRKGGVVRAMNDEERGNVGGK